VLNPVLHRVFRAARRVRGRAGWDGAPTSWGELLADAVATRSQAGAGRSIRLRGTGALARSLSLSLRARGFAIEGVEGGARILVTASGRGRIVSSAEVEAEAPLEIWDFGVPRNVDPSVARIPGVSLHTLADVVALSEAAARTGSEASALAEAVVDEEVARFTAWQLERGAARSQIRLGRLLEHSAWGHGESRRRLLDAFAAVAGEAGDEDEAATRLALFERVMRRASLTPKRKRRGAVSLVGAGPGDPDLLTLRAATHLAEADVVYYDALVDRAVLDRCAPGARLVPVGKRRGAWSVSQEEIESALVQDARAGLCVVRLKGGDPFVFGRGSEEALALVRAGVPFEIVPGLSAGVAVPALAGIPLTHRGLSGSAAFVTAHDLGDGEAADGVRRRIAHLARGADTLVIFMAGAELDRLRATLLDAGLPAETPAALVESGGTAAQRIVTGTVDGLTWLGEGRGEGPVLIVIGRTVRLSETLRDGATSRTAAGRETRRAG
jgi:uroporphyrin-III C-methyltransferase